MAQKKKTKKRGSETPLEGRCGAKLRKSDPPRYCTKNPLKNAKRCRLHGGGSPRGIAHYRFKTGETSSYLPKNLAAIADELIKDEAYLSLKDQIVEARARQIELFQQLREGEVGQAEKMDQISQIWLQHRTAVAQKDQKRAGETAQLLDDLISKGLEPDYLQTWDLLTKLQDHTRKLVETEHKVRDDHEGMIPVELHLRHMDKLLAVIIRAFESHRVPAVVLEEIQEAYLEGTTGGSKRRQVKPDPKPTESVN